MRRGVALFVSSISILVISVLVILGLTVPRLAAERLAASAARVSERSEADVMDLPTSVEVGNAPEIKPSETDGDDVIAGIMPLETGRADAAPPVAEPLFQRPAIYTASTFRMPVPFRTQKDGSAFQGSNCGPAALGMVFEAYGMVESNADLRFLTHTYQGTVGRRGGTALEHMATVGADFGLEPIGLYEAGDFRRWSVEEIRAQVQAGNVVIPLVKYRLLPGHEGSTVRYDHYIVIYGVDGDRFLFHDPAYAAAEQGAGHWITAAQLDAAIAPTLVPREAVAFAGGSHGQLPALPL